MIVDKYAVDLSMIERRDSIVLSKGGITWRNLAIGQLKSVDPTTNRTVYSDIFRGSINLNCISFNGMTAEYFSSKIFTALVAFKDQFKKNGIHQILNMQIGEEQLLRVSSTAEVTTVPVMISYEVSSTILNVDTFNDIEIIGYKEEIDYRVTGSQEVTLYDHVDLEQDFDTVYTHAITLADVEQTIAPTENKLILSSPVKGIPIIGEFNIDSEVEPV